LHVKTAEVKHDICVRCLKRLDLAGFCRIPLFTLAAFNTDKLKESKRHQVISTRAATAAINLQVDALDCCVTLLNAHDACGRKE
jgi:hypothetical protein